MICANFQKIVKEIFLKKNQKLSNLKKYIYIAYKF